MAVRDPRRSTTSDSIWRWMHPLHSGEGFGLAGRLLVCASGVLPLLLALTGLLRWRAKRQAMRGKRQTARRALAAPH